MIMKRGINVVSLSIPLMALILVGCASSAAFIYRASPPISKGNKPLPLKLAVVSFKDLRGQNNRDYTPLMLVPIVPFASMHLDRPEAPAIMSSYSFHPSEDLGNAVVQELKQNQFFSEVFFTNRETEPGVDLILTGEIREARVDLTYFTYGLSVFGIVFWALGPPEATSHNAINITLTLKRATDEKVVWAYAISEDRRKTHGLYYNKESGFDGLPIILQKGLQGAMNDLSRRLQEKPLAYWRGDNL